MDLYSIRIIRMWIKGNHAMFDLSIEKGERQMENVLDIFSSQSRCSHKSNAQEMTKRIIGQAGFWEQEYQEQLF